MPHLQVAWQHATGTVPVTSLHKVDHDLVLPWVAQRALPQLPGSVDCGLITCCCAGKFATVMLCALPVEWMLMSVVLAVKTHFQSPLHVAMGCGSSECT